MLWLFFAVFAAACFALTNYLDKVVISRYVADIRVYMAYFGLMNGVAAAAILLLSGVESSVSLLPAFASGMLMMAATYLYLQALREDDVSSAVFAMFASPVFVVFLAAALIGEILTAQKYAGIALIVLGVLLPIVKRGLALRAGIKYMLAFALAIAINDVVYKYLLAAHSYASVLFWYWAGTLAASIALFVATRSTFVSALVSLGKINAAVWASQGAYIAGLAAFLAALSLQAVSIVSATAASQALFVIAYVTVAQRIVPKPLAHREKQGRTAIIAKIMSVALLTAGVYLLT